MQICKSLHDSFEVFLFDHFIVEPLFEFISFNVPALVFDLSDYSHSYFGGGN